MSIKKLSFLGLTMAALLGTATTGRAQGDSDPGLSTIGGLRSAPAVMIDDEIFENEKSQISIGHTFAEGERGTKLYVPQLELRLAASDRDYFHVKLPYQAVQGDLGHIGGLGNLTLAYTHVLPNADAVTWQFTGGLDIGTGSATMVDASSRALPMAYQSSRGSTDVIVGVSMTWKKYLNVSAGYQQAIINYNENNYDRFSVDNDLTYSTANYPLSRKLYRNGDVMMRIEGQYYGNRAGISAGPLAFYHLRNDLYQDINNKYRELDGSQGFTLNVAGSAFVRFGRYGEWKFDVTGAYPLVQRDLAPDGLRREWMVMPRLTFFFNQDILLF
ncbi:MAG: hypothetical protein EOP51_04705 [Sphingobacteriales bacterium]|nr:MAG: hypothetical protein EOP51_04705 [Sphingobacteriales bacterium]